MNIERNQEKERKTYRCCAARTTSVEVELIVESYSTTKACDCAAVSGEPRLEALHESQSKNWPGQVTSANALVEAIITAIKISDKCGLYVTLIVWDLKVVREATTGVNCRNLGVAVPSNGIPRDGVPSAADASDPGACESADMVRDLYLRLYYTMSHTYRMRGSGGGTGLCESRRWPRSPQHRHRRCRSR